MPRPKFALPVWPVHHKHREVKVAEAHDVEEGGIDLLARTRPFRSSASPVHFSPEGATHPTRAAHLTSHLVTMGASRGFSPTPKDQKRDGATVRKELEELRNFPDHLVQQGGRWCTCRKTHEPLTTSGAPWWPACSATVTSGRKWRWNVHRLPRKRDTGRKLFLSQTAPET